MDRVATLNLSEIVVQEVQDYNNSFSYDTTGYVVQDKEQQIYMFVTVPDAPHPFPARAVVMARIVGDTVIIDEDITDRPLVDALLRAGVPREKIVLGYAGETLKNE